MRWKGLSEHQPSPPSLESPMTMQAAVVGADRPATAAPQDRHTHLKETIEHVAHLLPAQGPITVFIHHNTLHAFEELPFEEAVKKGARVFGCHPYLPEDRYRAELSRGRIRCAELQAVLQEDLGTRAHEPILHLGSRLELRLAMLQYALHFGPTEELLWFVAETDALRRIRPDASAAVRARLIAETRRWGMRDLRGGNEASRSGPSRRDRDSLGALLERFGEETMETWDEATWEAFTLQALWHVCCDGVGLVLAFPPLPPAPLRHRDLLFAATAQDADLLVHETLIGFCAAFLDQGLARWQLPHRDEGFYRSFCALYRQAGGPPQRWLRGLAEELARLQDSGVGPLASILESLDCLGVAESDWDGYLAATLLALPGWGGMLEQIEQRGDRVVHPVSAGTLIEFLAIRLLLDRWALTYSAREALGFTGPLRALPHEIRKLGSARKPRSAEQRAFAVFQLAQVLGWAPADLQRLSGRDWATLLEEIEAFSSLERRRILHLAYERHFYTRTLDAIALHVGNPAPSPRQPRFQAVFCLDEREESLRRHIEEIAPDALTFSTAGFFSIAMYFRGAADAHFVPLCPAVIRPRHWVAEEVVENQAETHQRQAKRRRVLGMASHQFHLGSRSFAAGALLAGAVGVLASIPLIARTLVPRLTARIRNALGRIVQMPQVTRLQLERREPAPGPENGQRGFTLAEMTDIAEKVLREMGLTTDFAPLVLIIGHGSTSMNNPHESAHDCGACGGARGGPNARALAQMLNDPRIRDGLRTRGLILPAETFFVGGMHNTSDETVKFADLDLLPASHRQEFIAVQALIERACDRDAHERCRRFHSAPLTLSFTAARQHVEGRAEDLAQVRPEWGHASNAICIVGRRAWTRGLFLDRRAFLTSYDPTQDDAEHSILLRILSAVFPVCAGISLEYYFSYVDNTGWGSGTKLPHNIAAMLGVMDGAASDLRTGLPWQMVEIHEPMRLLCIIETTAEAMLGLMERNPSIAQLCRNGWVRLAVLHPETRQLRFFQDGVFQEYQPQASVLPSADSSLGWYRGWRDHLEFAAIRA
jgi:uncharacterized protein